MARLNNQREEYTIESVSVDVDSLRLSKFWVDLSWSLVNPWTALGYPSFRLIFSWSLVKSVDSLRLSKFAVDLS